MDNRMQWLLGLYGPVVLFAVLVALYDWLDQRQQRRAHENERRKSA